MWHRVWPCAMFLVRFGHNCDLLCPWAQGLVGHITRMLGSVVQAAKNVWEGAFA